MYASNGFSLNSETDGLGGLTHQITCMLLRGNNHASFRLFLRGILAIGRSVLNLIGADMTFKIYLLKKLPAQRTLNPRNVTNQTPTHPYTHP